MLVRVVLGSSGRPGGSAGFSRNSVTRQPASTCITPKRCASVCGIGYAAMVMSAPVAWCCSSMCRTFIL